MVGPPFVAPSCPASAVMHPRAGVPGPRPLGPTARGAHPAPRPGPWTLPRRRSRR